MNWFTDSDRPIKARRLQWRPFRPGGRSKCLHSLTKPIGEFGASKVTLAPNEPAPSSRFEAIFRDQEFDRYQGQARVQSYADAAFRSIPDRERENVIQNTEESPAIARRPLQRSLVKFVFEVAQHSHTNPSQKIAQAEYVWASRSLRTLTGTAQLSRTKTPTVTRAHRNQD